MALPMTDVPPVPTPDSAPAPPGDPFYLHLIALLDVYDRGPYPGATVPVPRYNGPSSWETDKIIRTLGVVAKRMWVAEEKLRGLGIWTGHHAGGGGSGDDETAHQQEFEAAAAAAAAAAAPTTQSQWHPQSQSQWPPPPPSYPTNEDPYYQSDAATLDSDQAHSIAQAQAQAQSQSDGQSGAQGGDDNDIDHRETRRILKTAQKPHRCTMCGSWTTGGASTLLDPGGGGGYPAYPTDPLSSEESSPLSATEELKLLKAQVQDVARVCNAVARGDLSQKITVPVQGVVMVQLKDVINGMVDKLGQFAKEVTRVSQEVGTEGKLGGQALVLDVEGTWRELTGVVNKLAANLTNQVRSIAKVTKAVALGDLSKQIEVDARGEILDLKNTVNGMVVRLRALAAEVTRVTLEVGSQGKLGGQAHVPDVEGVWFELVRNVNRMCSSLTDQVRSIAMVTTAVARGDLTQKITIQVEGEMSTLKGTVNSMVDQLSAFASEVTRVALEVGTQGILGGQAKVEGVQGTWADLTRNVNKMASNLTDQVRSISEVTKAVAAGDLTKLVNVDVQGEMLDLKMTVNSMVSQLSTLANEVTRVSLEVGDVEGAYMHDLFSFRRRIVVLTQLPLLSSTPVIANYQALTDNVNLMAMNLTNQVRSIAQVTKAVAGGDLTKKIDVDARGEILELKDTVNGMTASLSVFADEVTRCVSPPDWRATN
ncbi:atypical/HisK protein kinase [Coprinopsis cinerea okayama7|uniref:Atypical/HisK protein kinase n=1 Tax=Coprinopsis cinerea (strain Okayama-7 / 130 / ATCC MYA-4618 / FGSC 9003) TaxID=240176 RepID=A8P1C0_COPC7|nr:atypical/HisK protein kinase [Coprinopsis cinerea okayama7\|eukprot:XP_001838064.2 atypical/HisK protein kinase [Coprinopsis cinerea okayama7\